MRQMTADGGNVGGNRRPARQTTRTEPANRAVGLLLLGVLVAGCQTAAQDARDRFGERPDAEQILADYAAKPHHKAMAVASGGAASWAFGDGDLTAAVDRALETCGRDHADCTLYRIGEVVVSPGAGRAKALDEARAESGGVDDMPEGTATEMSAKIQSLLNWRRPEDALALAESWVAAAPEDGLAHAFRGWALSRMDRMDDALEAGRRSTQLAPGSDWAHFRYGEDLVRVARFEEATAAYRRALAIRPNYDDALLGLHKVFTDLGRHQDAYDLADSALSRRPGYLLGYASKATAEAGLDRVDAALTTLEGASEAATGDLARALLLRTEASVLLQAGRVDAAIAAASDARAADPRDAEVAAVAARTLAAAGCVEAAADRLRDGIDAADERPADARLLAETLADVLARAGTAPEEAVERAEAADRAGAPASAMAVHGWALFRAGRAEEAVTALEDARIRLPGNALVAAQLGAVYRGLNRVDEAEALLFEALARSPGHYAKSLANSQIEGRPVPDQPDAESRLDGDACEALARQIFSPAQAEKEEPPES